MKNTMLVLLAVTLFLLPGCAEVGTPAFSSLQEVVGPETEEEACEVLIKRIAETRLFPDIREECFICELEDESGRIFEFAIRFNEEKCGRYSPSNLLDRFLVCQRSPVILWYDLSEDRYLPLEYAFIPREQGGN